MDTRTGKIYGSVALAAAAGARVEDLAPVQPGMNGTVTVSSGPFKGRVYQVVNGVRGRRRRDLEAPRTGR